MLTFLTISACLTPDPPVEASCTACHGSSGNPAPPVALGGESDPASRGVGAHEGHLASTLSLPTPCESCHTVPATVDAEGHVDSDWPAEVHWGGIAAGSDPFDAVGLTCAVYCHGVTLGAGGSNTTPEWLGGAPEAACGTCHGNPPPTASHSGVDPSACTRCHADGGLDDVQHHVDGALQVVGGTTGGESCAQGCHGTDTDPSPPPDTHGDSDPSLVTVGAHEAHVDGTARTAPVPCQSCHVVPASSGDPGHIDASPAEITFGGLASKGGRDPQFDGLSCAGTYCHGDAVPAWTGGGADAACGSCHGNPPAEPAIHDGVEPGACGGCHDGGPDNPANHVNGTVDL
ncbi:MAG: CxxxxCH/CxxCH domain-containing protein [Myxococcota bacterium]